MLCKSTCWCEECSGCPQIGVDGTVGVAGIFLDFSRFHGGFSALQHTAEHAHCISSAKIHMPACNLSSGYVITVRCCYNSQRGLQLFCLPGRLSPSCQAFPEYSEGSAPVSCTCITHDRYSAGSEPLLGSACATAPLDVCHKFLLMCWDPWNCRMVE
jgi:hypothetical protein